jgi:hypothetical protein
MKYLVGDDWRELFDVVIVQARKPKFFTERSRPLRLVLNVFYCYLLSDGSIYLSLFTFK